MTPSHLNQEITGTRRASRGNDRVAKFDRLVRNERDDMVQRMTSSQGIPGLAHGRLRELTTQFLTATYHQYIVRYIGLRCRTQAAYNLKLSDELAGCTVRVGSQAYAGQPGRCVRDQEK